MPTDVFDLYGKIKLDTSEYSKSLENADKSFSGFGDKIKAGLGIITKATTAAVGAGAAAVGKIVSDSMQAYGSYEQLVGGVETLFGDSAQTVLANSEKAFATAGMSMNEYMETSIQSAAALINSLEGDQAKAADLMDLSIIDMSDNVNKMGTTMEAVQNAYRGFSRGNFTMLDNLALGFAGTKEGMQELLDKAEQISGIKYDISSYSDIVQAIHVVQQEMGITGTTAAEAADTIQGSAGSMKAALENLKVELVKGDGDIGKSIDILVSSALTAFDNIEPKIERALGGMTQFVGKAAPIITEKLPPIIEQIVPPLLTASSSLVYAVGKGVAKALPSLLGSVGNLATGIYSDFAQSDLGAFDWLREDAVKVVDSVKQTLGSLDIATLFDKAREYGSSLNELWVKVGDGFTWAVDNVFGPLVEWSANDVLPSVFTGLSAAVDLTREALEFLETPAKAVWQEFLQPLAGFAGDVISVGLGAVANGLKAISEAVDGVDWNGYWIDMFSGEFGSNWQAGWNDLKNMVEEVGDSVDDFFDVSEETRAWNRYWQGVGADIYSFQHDVFDPFTENVRLGYEVIEDAWNSFSESVQLGYQVIADAFDWIYEKVSAVADAVIRVKDAYLDFTSGIGESTYDAFHDEDGNFKMPWMANGGSLTSGQAIIAEAGPELLEVNNGVATVTPLNRTARNTAVGSGVNVNINLGGVAVTSDYDVDRMSERMIKKLSERLADLSVRQQRAVGGTGWD